MDQGSLQRLQRRVSDVVAPHLGRGERVEATLAAAWTGPPMWLVIPSGIIAIPLLVMSMLGWYRSYAVVVTDRRVLLVRCAMWREPYASAAVPSNLEKALPREAIGGVKWKPGKVSSTLRFARTDGAERWKFHVAERQFKTDAQQVAAVLGP
jgi:hypothetical protein